MEWLFGGGVIILMHLFAVEAAICNTRSAKSQYPDRYGYILSNPVDDANGYWKYESGSSCSCYINLSSPANISTEVLSTYSHTNFRLTQTWDKHDYPVTLEKNSERTLARQIIAHQYFSTKVKSFGAGSGQFEIYYGANISLRLICSEKDLITEEPTTSTTSTSTTSTATTSLGDEISVSVTSFGGTIVPEVNKASLTLVIGISCGVLGFVVILVAIIIIAKWCQKAGVKRRKNGKRQENPDQGIELTAREGGTVYAEIAEAFAENDEQESDNDYDDAGVKDGFEEYEEIPRPMGNGAGYAAVTSPRTGKGALKCDERTDRQNQLSNPPPIQNDAVYAEVDKHSKSKNGRNVAMGAKPAGNKNAPKYCVEEENKSDGFQQNSVYAQVIKKKQGTAQPSGSNAAAGQKTLAAIPSLTNGVNQTPGHPEDVDSCGQVYAQVNKKKRQPDLALYDDGSSYKVDNSGHTVGCIDAGGQVSSGMSANSPGTPRPTLSNVDQEPVPVSATSLTQTTGPGTVQREQNGAAVVDATSSKPISADALYSTLSSGDSRHQGEDCYGLDQEMTVENLDEDDSDTYDRLQFSSIKKMQTSQQK